MTDWKTRLSPRHRLVLGGAALLALGAAGGAGAVQLTRPPVEMAPAVPIAAARLAQTSGIVTVKGRVAETYGDRFLLQDGSGRVLVDVGPAGAGLAGGSMVTVQGRYRDGQLHASFLVDGQGNVQAVGAPPHPPHHRHGPPPPGDPEVSPPPPGAGALPPLPPAAADLPASGATAAPPTVPAPSATPGR